MDESINIRVACKEERKVTRPQLGGARNKESFSRKKAQ
jgi:hypothetical protein